MFTKVKDLVKSGLEFVELSNFGTTYLYEIDHIFMFQQLENPNFSQCSDRELEQRKTFRTMCKKDVYFVTRTNWYSPLPSHSPSALS